jgi:hypothetical protein
MKPVKVTRGIAACMSVLMIGGCSLAQPMLLGATDYNTMASDYSDQVLVTAVLRARDRAPVNLTNLSTITGSMNVQGTLGLSVPFGTIPNAGSRNSVSPMLQGTSSPTWSQAPLNTQAFSVGILQPISPTYVVSKWNTGIDQEFLLLLFLKSMKFIGSDRDYINNPDSPADMARFQSKLDQLIREQVRIKSFTVLEPVGPIYKTANISTIMQATAPVTGTAPTGACETIAAAPPGTKPVTPAPPPAAPPARPPHEPADTGPVPGTTTTTTTSGSTTTTTTTTPGSAASPPPPAPPTPGCGVSTTTNGPVANPMSATILSGLNMVTGLSDGQYHVGNAGDLDSDRNYTGLQLYREYTNQVALCANDRYIHQQRRTTPRNFSAMPAKDFADLEARAMVGIASMMKVGPSSAPSPAPQSGGAPSAKVAGSAAPAASTGAGGASSLTSASLQANRISGILDYRACDFDQLVQHASTEKQVQDEDEHTFSHVEWRSIAEVIEYLGAIVRNPESVSWTPKDGPGEKNTVFRLLRAEPAGQGLITVYYRGHPYTVAGESNEPGDLPNDHSLQALKMLTELIGLIRLSSDIPIPQQFQVLP